MVNNFRKAALALTCFLAIATAADATSMIEDVFVDVAMVTRSGKRIAISSDGERLTSFTIGSGNNIQAVDVSFAAELSGPLINQARMYLDGAIEEGPNFLHILIPFQEWQNSAYDELSLMLTFEGQRIVRAAIVASGDLDRPLHIFVEESIR